jgi:nucleotide-binding universal stress UspA family protein
MAAHVRAAGIGDDVLADWCVYPGPPDRVIAAEASRVDASLVVLGPHRLGGAYPTEGTAYRVVTASKVPCLVLRSPLTLPLGCVLVPIDASDASRGALAVALSWSSALRRRKGSESFEPTRLVVLHVGRRADDAAEIVAAGVAAVRARHAGAAGIEIEERLIEASDPVASIVEHGENGPVDLIVLGTRGTAGPHGRLGSVSAAVLHSTRRPVLLVPPAVWRELSPERATDRTAI